MNTYQTQNTQCEENPKLIRFFNLMVKLDAQCEKYLYEKNFSNFTNQSFEVISSHLDINIINDTYESLTIEGYKVSKNDITFLYESGEEKSSKKISSKIDIQGYLSSYQKVTDKIKTNYGNNPRIDNNFFYDVNLTLFSFYPVAKKYDIPRAYRKENTRISGTIHLPPNHELVDDYMNKFINYINAINVVSAKDVIRKAILAHFFFTHIHPFSDGNGRTGRLLMNYTLGINGYKGITITFDQRERYIRSLKEASENNNIIPFTKFILNNLKA